MKTEHLVCSGRASLIPKKVPDSPTLKTNSFLLIFSWHVRIGLLREIETVRMITYCRFFYDTYFSSYLFRQEGYLLTAAVPDEEVIKKLRQSHRRLRRLFENLKDLRDLSLLEDKMEAHTIFEHRVLHRNIKVNLPAAECEQILRDEKRHGKVFINSLNRWHDRYWELR